ncbi:hypothetical protein A6F53_06750 [Levilactobacillus brevis]|uniref:MFS transporter n=1 Tax=Levilactobacillus brevis TaxID=1580 RepID=UPI00041EFB15|nr:MFS transporter [Levilactobacillus brevis]ANN48954.1 hypothetical protein A6F53_06750 [Levilactobacillus brevis]ATU69312.1 MFS transporter [Levilactobacillus brevis]
MKTQAIRWWVLACIGIMTFMDDLDASIVNVALPVINRALAINMGVAELIVSVYLITICVFLLPFGRLGDTFGKVRVFKWGMWLFVLGSLGCGLSPNIISLLLCRLIQGLGAAMTMSTNNGIITESFPINERGRALGWIGSFVALGMIAGPGIGGLLLSFLPWESIFWINVPIGLLLMGLGHAVLTTETGSDDRPVFDWLGSGLIGIGISGFFGYLYAGQQLGYGQPLLMGLLAVAIIATLVFILYEIKCQQPLLDLKIFRKTDFTVGVGTALLVFVANNFYMVLTPFYLENAKVIGASVAGLIMMILPVVQVLMAPIAGRIADNQGPFKLCLTGLLIILSAQVGFVLINQQTPLTLVGGLIGLLGLGNALFQSPNNALIMGAVEQTQLGVAGSVNALSRNIGMVLGNALATSLLFVIMSALTRSKVTNFDGHFKRAFITGQSWVYLLGSLLVLLAIGLVSFNTWKNKKMEALSDDAN